MDKDLATDVKHGSKECEWRACMFLGSAYETIGHLCLMVGDEQHALRLFQTHLEVDAHMASVGCRVCLSREGLVYCGGCRVARLLACNLVFLCDALLKQEGD